jgi:hypothetical protein
MPSVALYLMPFIAVLLELPWHALFFPIAVLTWDRFCVYYLNETNLSTQ